MYSVLNTLSEYNTFTHQKALLHTLFCLLLKSSKAFSVPLTYVLIYSLTKFVLEDGSENFVKLAEIYSWRSLLFLEYLESPLFE